MSITRFTRPFGVALKRVSRKRLSSVFLTPQGRRAADRKQVLKA
jgi:hypothetical protein